MDHFLAILDQDKKYIRKLSTYLSTKGNVPFPIMAFDDKAKLQGYLLDHEAMVLLVHQRLYSEELEELAAKIVRLVDQKEEECLKGAQPCICKYQSGDAIAKKILGICAADKDHEFKVINDSSLRQNRAQIIGLYSPIKRSLQTSFSFVYANLMSQNKKTLYLNFEIFAGFSVWFERQYETDLLDLMYYLEMGQDKFLLKLSGMVETMGNLHFIPPALSYEDFVQVKRTQWIKLIETIAGCGAYEVIILDLNDQMDGVEEMLPLCDHIFSMIKPDSLSYAKVDAYKYWLKSIGKEDVLAKTVLCKLPFFQGLPQNAYELTYSQLGDFIKKEYGDQFI